MTFEVKTIIGKLAVLICAWCLGAAPGFAADDITEPPPRVQTPAQHRTSGLAQRVTLLSAELGLDAQQQTAVRRILEAQREQVLKVWNDTAVPAAYRVSATKAISDQTADRIRSLLSEEQKARYLAARKSRDAATQAGSPGVEDWMSMVNSH